MLDISNDTLNEALDKNRDKVSNDALDDALDAEMRTFVRRTEACYPPDAGSASIVRQRALYDAMCRTFHAGRPPGIAVADERIALAGRSVALRRYTPGNTASSGPAPHIAYLHGGGFVVGGLDSHDDVCAEICARTGLGLTSIDYRLAPEHPHPAAFDDALAAVVHLGAGGHRPLLLCGDSAGGNLAAAVAAAARGTALEIVGQVLIYPGLGGGPGNELGGDSAHALEGGSADAVAKGSYLTRANAPLLSVRDVFEYERLRLGPNPPGDPASAWPLRASDFSGLPPTVVFSANLDPLCDDGRDYRDAVVAAGGRAKWVEEAGLVHGYLRARHLSACARESFTRMVESLTMLDARRWRE